MKNILAMAMMSTFAGAAFPQSSVTVFGILDLNIRHVDNDSAGNLSSLATDGLNQSRLGFRGVEDLGGGLKAGYWLEAAIAADTGSVNAQRFWHRRSTVSLISDTLGELRLGRDHTATFYNLLVFDPFTTGLGTAVNIFPAQIGTQTLLTMLRADNAVNYFLPPRLGGIYGQATFALGEGPASPTNIGGTNNKYAGGRIGYAAGPLDAAIAYGQTWTTTPEKLRTWDVGISYELGFLKLFGQYATLEYDQWDRKNYMIGATVPVGAGYIRGSYTHSSFDGPACPAAVTTCDDAAQVAIGYVHNLSKRTALYTTAAVIDNGDGAAISLPGGPAGLGRGERSVGFEMGVRHSF